MSFGASEGTSKDWRWFGGGLLAVLAVGEVGWGWQLPKSSPPLFSHPALLGVFPACFLHLPKKDGQELHFFF